MFEQKVLFYKFFSSSKIVGAIKVEDEGYFFAVSAIFAVFCLFKIALLVHSEARAAF